MGNIQHFVGVAISGQNTYNYVNYAKRYLIKMVAQFLGEKTNSVLNWIFPSKCLVCTNLVNGCLDICLPCLRELPRNSTACPRCAEPTPTNLICGKCQTTPPAFDYAFSPFLYKTPIDNFVQALKYQHTLYIRHTLSSLFSHALAEKNAKIAYKLPDCVVPVPLHPNSLKRRGFNQALEIVRPVVKKLELTMPLSAVYRSRDTVRQTGLPRKQRRANVRGVFSSQANFSGQHVVIFDDVITTTSTANELAKEVRRAGAQKIGVWALARA